MRSSRDEVMPPALLYVCVCVGGGESDGDMIYGETTKWGGG